MCRIGLVLLAATVCGHGIALGAVQWPDNGHWYEARYVPNGITWLAAKNAAESSSGYVGSGGYLATITSLEENDFVANLIWDPKFWIVDVMENSQGPYLGGRQDTVGSLPCGPADNWTWISGEPWGYTNWDLIGPEPNDGDDTYTENGQEDFLQFFRRGSLYGEPLLAKTWNDIPGDFSDVKGYVVEWNTKPVPAPSSFVCLLGMGLVWLLRRRS